MKEELIKHFAEIFGESTKAEVFFAPGRVNLIGEHTDYNGGHVFPCALSIGTYAVVRVRDDNKLRFFSLNFKEDGIYESDLEDLSAKPEDGWTNYPKGVIWAFAQKGYKVSKGFDMLVFGNIPNGSGLSSSASLEVLTGYILNHYFDFGVSNLDLALIGQFSENKYNGVNCGIMDQFAVAMGRKDCAMFLDTATLEYEYVPVKLDGYKLVICCTNKVRGLNDSKYNERRSECESALERLQTVANISSLGDLDAESFENIKDVIDDEVKIRRARHAVYENQRTIVAVDMLKAGKLGEFGRLMNESHASLRDDYEVTGTELDTIVASAQKQNGVIGARMTGAGFGGCAVALVKEDAVDAFVRNVGEEYLKAIGYAASFYPVDIGDGPF